MRSRRWLSVLTVATAAIALLPACGEENDDADELRAAISRSEQVASRFVYSETVHGSRMMVRGLVEDDFRYKARVSLDGRDLLDEVALDDALYVRLLERSALDRFLDEGADLGSESSMEGFTVADVLRSRRWVVDPVGAPPVLTTAAIEESLGVDVVRDALLVLRYAEDAIGEAFAITKYNKEALDYKPSEDPFPTPEDGSGVTRYDYVAPNFPRPDSATSGGAALPGTAHFRKMSVYVKDGLVIQVMEQITATGDVAEGLLDYARVFYADTPDVYEEIEQLVRSTPPEQWTELLIGGVNEQREVAGEQPIRIRTMSMQFLDLGEDVAVDIPSDGVEGDLRLLVGRGRQTVADAAEETGTEGAKPPT